ncbi:hypothetical protein PMAYCL1PPCAC_21483, partial [Pristionchus mayeri]
TYFFTQLGIERSRAQLQSTLLTVVLTLSCVFSTSLMDRLPRRAMLLSFTILQIFSLFAFSMASHFGFPTIATVALFAVMFANGAGVGPVAWCTFPELVPLSHRSSMLSLCFFSRSVLVVGTNFATLPLYDWIGGICFIPVFVIPSIVFLVFVVFYLPETACRETADIMNDLRGKS